VSTPAAGISQRNSHIDLPISFVAEFLRWSLLHDFAVG